MRFAPFAIAAVVAVALAAPVQAQDGSTRIIIRKPPPKSYLDPGTVVKPGGAPRYTNYLDLEAMRFPTYGGDGGIQGSRYPLPGPYYLPGY